MRLSDVTMGTALWEQVTPVLLCSCSQRPWAGEPPIAALTLPWAPGSSAGWPFVSWGWVSPQQAGPVCVCVCVSVSVSVSAYVWWWLHICSTWLSPTSVPTGHTRAGVVSQSPGYRVAGRGQTVNFRCDPIPGHQVLYWYRQMLGQGLEYLTYFQGKEEPDKSGMPKNQFSAERPESTYSYLKIQPVEPEDSALYLCASSPATAWHSHLLPVHKPLRAHFSSWFPEMPEKGATCSSLCRGGKWIWGFSCSDSWRSENYLWKTRASVG